MFETFGSFNVDLADESSVITVYSDPSDINDRFSISQRLKYFERLHRQGRACFRIIERGPEAVSATMARKALESNDRDSFMQLMPDIKGIERVWEILKQR
jgi:hypothetical protein